MNNKKHVLIFTLLLILILIALLPACGDNGNGGPVPPDSTATAIDVITPQQSRDMQKVLEGLKNWRDRYKGRAGTLTQTEFVGRDLTTPYLQWDPPYNEYF